MSEIPLATLLEATLFSAGRSLSLVELSETLGYEEDEISESLVALQSTVKRRRGGGLQVVEIGGKWAMEVKPMIADHLPKETKSELPPKLLKAAALMLANDINQLAVVDSEGSIVGVVSHSTVARILPRFIL